MRRLGAAILILFLSHTARGASEVVPNSTLSPASYELGVVTQFLYPNIPSLPPVTTYGILFGIPALGNPIRLQLLYGNLDTTNLFLLELDYALRFQTPFFSGFLVFGPHWLRYFDSASTNDSIGGNIGFGLSLAMAKNFEAQMAMKFYIQQQLVISFGGGFSFLL